MHADALAQYLHDHIPLSRAMAVTVQAVEPDTVVLAAPLAPNINHRDTVFGGSASAVAILAAWSLLHTRLRREGLARRLVIQRNQMEYLQPIVGDFSAQATLDASTPWPGFVRMLARKGKARAMVRAVLRCQGQVVGELVGEFVALDVGG